MKAASEWIEHFVWNARLIMLLPVFASLLAAFVMLALSTLNTLTLLRRTIDYFGMTAEQQAAEQGFILSNVIGVVDQFLMVAILVIFADGLYELFIGKIGPAEGSPIGTRLLVITSLDDLKDRLVSLVLVLLVVKFFQLALTMKFETPQDLLLLAAGVASIGAALYLTKKPKLTKPNGKTAPPAE